MTVQEIAKALNREQLGQLRHIRNLAGQPDNDWSHMAAARPMQEDFGSYRYQLAYMFLALAVAHRHHLPAAPGAFRPVMDALIRKMLLPEVWAYWRDTSAGGNPAFPDMPQPSQSNDPVAAMNIMYSGYVQLMTLMYHYLFDDPKYAQPGAIAFRMRPMFWGGAGEGYRFEYDEKSLNDHIYWQMAQSGFLGVACEPGLVFQICNQIPIFAFRMHDFLYGTNLAPDVTKAYLKAWSDFGVLTEDGHYNTMVMDWQRVAVPGRVGLDLIPRLPVWDAWCGMLMHIWNDRFVEDQYVRGVDDFITRGNDGTVSLKISDAVLGDAVAPQHGVTTFGHLGFVACWAGEMGDTTVRDGLLRYADRHMGPRWSNGGLYYPRQDQPLDAEGQYRLMDPLTGNALLALARLLPAGGLRSIYQDRWSHDRFARPALREVNGAVDIQAADYDAGDGALSFTIAPPHGEDSAEVNILIGPFAAGADCAALAARLPAQGLHWASEGADSLRLTGQIDRPAGFTIAAR